MREVDRVTRKVAATNAAVLILGETGTGKELIAAAVHQLSQRGGGPFVKVNCGALSESLLESELFGHVRGAFTGAVANRAGRFEAANGGTIFLDEINSTTSTLQVKMLRVLQEKEFERVGDTTSLRTDARVIAASNRNLMAEVRAERFREDLYWRLNVVPVYLPPLRERRDDIPDLVAYFLDHYNEVNDRYVAHIAPGVMEALQDYHWPGNVRELQNYVERAVVMSNSDELELGLLPDCVTKSDPVRQILSSTDVRHEEPPTIASDAALPPSADVNRDPSPGPAMHQMDLPLLTQYLIARGLSESEVDTDVHAHIVDKIERELILQVLQQCGGTQTKAAAKLGMNRNTLYKKIKQYGLG